jgi:hypothetical protein
MEAGTVLFETWVPAGGFKLERRKGKTPDGALLTADWLVPAWASDGLTAAHPCAGQPCIHRVLAECRQDQAGRVAACSGFR